MTDKKDETDKLSVLNSAITINNDNLSKLSSVFSKSTLDALKGPTRDTIRNDYLSAIDVSYENTVKIASSCQGIGKVADCTLLTTADQYAVRHEIFSVKKKDIDFLLWQISFRSTLSGSIDTPSKDTPIDKIETMRRGIFSYRFYFDSNKRLICLSKVYGDLL